MVTSGLGGGKACGLKRRKQYIKKKDVELAIWLQAPCIDWAYTLPAYAMTSHSSRPDTVQQF